MFVLLLTNMGAHGFNSKELTHDLDHHGQTGMLASDHVHTVVLEADENLKPESLDELEHHLLHAAGTAYFLVSSPSSLFWNASVLTLTPASGSSSLPLAETESPFRPPRSSAFI